MGSFYITSEIESIDKQTLLNCLVNLKSKSPEIAEILQAFTVSAIDFKLTAVNNTEKQLAWTFARIAHDGDPAYIEIKIPEAMLYGTGYVDENGVSHQVSLERVLSHELYHADIYNRYWDTVENTEVSAQHFENERMAQYFNEVPRDLSSGFVHFPYGAISIYDSTNHQPALGVSALLSWFISMQNQFSQVVPVIRDPLVIDLDGDGVQPDILTSSHVYFDIDSDGMAESVSWVVIPPKLIGVGSRMLV